MKYKISVANSTTGGGSNLTNKGKTSYYTYIFILDTS